LKNKGVIVSSIALTSLIITSMLIYTNLYASSRESLIVYTPTTLVKLVGIVKNEYTSMRGNIEVNIILGSTGMLLNRIKVTGIGDVLLTADHNYMLEAMRNGLVYNDSVRVVSYVFIALIVRRGNPFNITCLNDLVVKNVKIGVANPDVAPFGKMAVEVLKHNNIFDLVKDKLLVFQDVGSVAKQLILGYIDVALLPFNIHYQYVDETEIIWLKPGELPKQSCQLIAVLKTTRTRELAYDFVNYLVNRVKNSDEFLPIGIVGKPSDIPRMTPYSVNDVVFEEVCMVG